MKATPQVTADVEEYPELRVLIDTAVRNVVTLMQIHDIIDLRRVRKVGVFDRPYVKDVVTPMGIPGVPVTVSAARYSSGVALLDYLETIGVSGISLELTREDVSSLVEAWRPKTPEKSVPEKRTDESLDPTPVSEGGKADDAAAGTPPDAAKDAAEVWKDTVAETEKNEKKE